MKSIIKQWVGVLLAIIITAGAGPISPAGEYLNTESTTQQEEIQPNREISPQCDDDYKKSLSN